ILLPCSRPGEGGNLPRICSTKDRGDTPVSDEQDKCVKRVKPLGPYSRSNGASPPATCSGSRRRLTWQQMRVWRSTVDERMRSCKGNYGGSHGRSPGCYWCWSCRHGLRVYV